MGFFEPLLQTICFHHGKCYIGSKVPGHSIDKSFGTVYQVTKGMSMRDINDKIKEIMDSFVESAIQMGANAVINFRCEFSGEGHGFFCIILYGEAVILSD